MRSARPTRLPPLLPTERVHRTLSIRLPIGDAELVLKSLLLTADRAESTATRLRDLAPELRTRAARLRRIAAALDGQAEALQ